MIKTESNIPALRFKDEQGSDFPDWTRNPIGKIGEIIGGGTPATNQNRFWNGNINWFTPSEIKSKYSSSSIRKISEQGLAQSSAKLLPVGTILFTSRATIGEVSIAREECTTNQGFQSFVVNSFSYSNEYTYYWIVKNKILFLRIANGSTYLEVTNSEIKKILFDAPNLKEQQKIATFLSSVDTKIEQLGKKKALLEQFKKGMMQKLFNQEIRFKYEQGNDYPDWEEKKLGEIGKVVTGKTPSTMNQSLWGGEIQFITPSDINDDNKYQTSTERYIKQTKDIRVLPLKSIIYTCIASIGKICISVKPCATNQQINSLTPSNSYDNEFIYYSLLKLTPRIKATQATTTLPIINKTEFKKINMSIPCLSEQQKIAAFLAAIDKKIELVAAQLKQAQIFKKGLLQQMFV